MVNWRAVGIISAGSLLALGIFYFVQQSRHKSSSTTSSSSSSSASQGEAEKVEKKEKKAEVTTTSSEELNKDQVKDILLELEKAAQSALKAIMKAQSISSEKWKSVAESPDKEEKAKERRVENVQLIVKALEPVAKAQKKFQEQRGVGEKELHLAIERFKEDKDIHQLNRSIQNIQGEIEKYSRMLVS